MEPLTLLAALGPLVIDAGKALIGRFVAPEEFKPANVAEYAELRRIDLELFQAMQAPGAASYPWVEAIIKLQRPALATTVMLIWAWAHLMGAAETGAVDNFAAAIGFYLFGDRTLFHMRNKGAK